MTPQEIDSYKKTAKPGDRIGWRQYPDIWYVQRVEERGPVVSLERNTPNHQHIIDFSIMGDYRIIHKEP